MLGEAAKRLMALAVTANKTIVVAEMEFRKKKVAMQDEARRYARMLSSFAS